MQIVDLGRVIWTLDADTPRHRELERLLGIGAEFGRPWYRSQKEHWLGWLGDYHTPGAYGRTKQGPNEARSVYNRINCAPMLFWLCEASGVEDSALNKAFDGVAERTADRVASQCGTLRKAIRWEDVSAALASRPPATIEQIAEADDAVLAARARLREKLGLPAT